MQRFYTIFAPVILLATMLIAACVPITREANTTTTDTPPTLPASEFDKLEEYDTNNFTNPTIIDNQWMPLKPGTRFVYAGTTVEDDGKVVDHRLEVVVTNLTKVIDGVRSVVSWDQDYSDGELREAELAFYAQDNDGNIWRMGEYPEEYEDGKIIANPTWINGLADARAGIDMPARPQLGTPSYPQGWGPAVGWNDRGQIDQMGQKICVPAGCYENVMVISETSQAEPKAQQLKFWAPGLGNIRVGWRGSGEKTQEVLELVEHTELSPEALVTVHAEALKLEASAYANSKDVYALTSPLE